jgi:hypothetical protein
MRNDYNDNALLNLYRRKDNFRTEAEEVVDEGKRLFAKDERIGYERIRQPELYDSHLRQAISTMTTTNQPATVSCGATGRGTPLQTTEIVVSRKIVKSRRQKMDAVYAQTGGVMIPATVRVSIDATLNQMIRQPNGAI